MHAAWEPATPCSHTEGKESIVSAELLQAVLVMQACFSHAGSQEFCLVSRLVAQRSVSQVMGLKAGVTTHDYSGFITVCFCLFSEMAQGSIGGVFVTTTGSTSNGTRLSAR